MVESAIQQAARLFRASPPETPEHPTEKDMAFWRERIDALDRIIVHLLNERAVCAAAIGGIKKKLGIPVYVPTREEEVIRNVTTHNPGPLSDQAVRRLYERIIDETRSLERHLYQHPSDTECSDP